MHCLGLPDEYMDGEDPELTIKHRFPSGFLSSDTVVTKKMREKSDPDATLMSDEFNTVLKPRHAWNIGLEVREFLSRRIGREVACNVFC